MKNKKEYMIIFVTVAALLIDILGREFAGTLVEADGGVYPCDFYVLDEYNLGNLNENSFEEIQKKRNAIQFVENSCNHLSECKECEYFFICRGGCRKHRDNMGVMDGKNRFCQSYRMFFDACLSRMVEISKRCR